MSWYSVDTNRVARFLTQLSLRFVIGVVSHLVVNIILGFNYRLLTQRAIWNSKTPSHW
jgi:hypothetical protein